MVQEQNFFINQLLNTNHRKGLTLHFGTSAPPGYFYVVCGVELCYQFLLLRDIDVYRICVKSCQNRLLS